MKNQLTNLRKFVQSNIEHKTFAQQSPQTSLSTESNWVEELPIIKENMFTLLSALVLSKKNDRLIKRHVQQAQRECISLLNLLPDTTKNEVAVSGIVQATRACLVDVLNHLSASHSAYFDWTTYAPAQQGIEVQCKIERNMNLLKSGFKRKKVVHELQNLICGAFTKFTNLKQVTYEQMHYMEHLQKSLIKLCNQIENPVFDELLMEHLFYFGFNECAFVVYCKKRINESLNQLYHAPAQYEKLCYYEKCLMAQQEKTKFRFCTQRLSVKAQLLAFVGAELNYYQKRNDLLHHPTTQLGGKEYSIEVYRVKINLSADGLAYLIRLLCESQVIEANPRTHLINFIAKHFQTAGIGEKQLSPQSLGTKYKQVTQHTAMGIKALLQKMNKLLDADFGKG